MPAAETPAPPALPGPAALRELARAFAHVSDFQRFAVGLETALGRAEFFADARVRLLDAPAGRPDFSADRLTLPLAGAERLHGALHVGLRARGPEEPHEFGPEDLHLMSSLAAVLAAAMDHAVRHGEQRKNLEILSFLLDLAPVGLAAVLADGRVALANATARYWLGAAGAESLAEKLTPQNLGADWRARPQFHLRLDGRLIFAEARSCAPAAPNGNGASANGDTSPPHPDGAANGATAFVFADLTPQQAALMDGLARELYRCRWLGLRLSFALLESPQIPGGLLQRLPELRARLQPGEIAGPYDAHRVGLVLPGLDPGTARIRLRALATPSAGEISAAVVSAEGASSAERVLAAALDAMRPAAAALRPALLLHDDYAAVNDSLALLLRGRFELVKTTRAADALAHLRARPFDALVTEVDLREDGGGLELAREARRLQPSLRPIFTTVAHALPPAASDPILAGHLVLRKPFEAARLEETLTAALAAPPA